MDNIFDGFEVIHVEVGDNVVCDLCDKNYRGDDTEGGFIFQSKAICPDCSGAYLAGIDKYDERRFIRAINKPGCSFYDFVLNYRKERY